MKLVGAILCLAIACKSAAAMVIEFPARSESPDSIAVDAAIDFIIAPFGNPEEAPVHIEKIKSMAASLTPAFLDSLLKYLEDQSYWENPVDRKDELLALVPLITANSHFDAFAVHPLRGEIEAALARLQRYSALRGADGVHRNAIFTRIFAGLQRETAERPSNIVQFSDLQRARCEEKLSKPK